MYTLFGAGGRFRFGASLSFFISMTRCVAAERWRNSRLSRRIDDARGSFLAVSVEACASGVVGSGGSGSLCFVARPPLFVMSCINAVASVGAMLLVALGGRVCGMIVGGFHIEAATVSEWIIFIFSVMVDGVGVGWPKTDANVGVVEALR